MTAIDNGTRWGHRARCVLVAVLLLALAAPAAAMQIGVRAGANLGGGPNFNSQEVYLRSPLPWSVGDRRDWHLASHGEVNAGRVSVGGDALSTVGGVVGLWLQNPQVPLRFSVGTGPTYLSETELGGRDFGGHWQFTSHAGVLLALGANVALGFRVQHTSNAGLYSANDGYNTHALEVRLRF